MEAGHSTNPLVPTTPVEDGANVMESPVSSASVMLLAPEASVKFQMPAVKPNSRSVIS